jgi:hypothetical protein
MTKQLTKQTIGVGVAGTGFIGPAHIEGLRRNTTQVLGLLGSAKEKTEQKDGRAIFVIGDSTVGEVFLSVLRVLCGELRNTLLESVS